MENISYEEYPFRIACQKYDLTKLTTCAISVMSVLLKKKSKPGIAFIATQNELPIGWCLVIPSKHELWAMVFVSPNFRNKRIGTQLIHLAKKYSRNRHRKLFGTPGILGSDIFKVNGIDSRNQIPNY